MVYVWILHFHSELSCGFGVESVWSLGVPQIPGLGLGELSCAIVCSALSAREAIILCVWDIDRAVAGRGAVSRWPRAPYTPASPVSGANPRRGLGHFTANLTRPSRRETRPTVCSVPHGAGGDAPPPRQPCSPAGFVGGPERGM